MNLTNKTDAEIITGLRARRKIESENLVELLHYLKEVEVRRLDMAYSSINQYCIEELGYTKDEAYMRVQAMRLLKTMPETEKDIQSGALNLTAAARAQTAFRKENKRRKEKNKPALDKDEKSKVIDALKSTRDTQKTLSEFFPEQAAPEKTKPLNPQQTQIQFTADPEEMKMYEKLKGLLAHKNFEGSWQKLFAELAKIALEKLEKEPTRTAKPATPKAPVVPKRRRYISIHTKREVQKRSQGECEHIDTATGKRCHSTHALEIDHIIPLALGGTDEPANLRHLCSRHNKFAAWKVFGEGWRERQL